MAQTKVSALAKFDDGLYSAGKDGKWHKIDQSKAVAPLHETGPDNPSGIHPTEYKVLVRDIEVEAKTKGGIILPDDTKERKQNAQQEGILVAQSPAAWNYDGMIADKAPPLGSRVLYARFAGFEREGRDGVKYRIINDRDIVAQLD